LTTQNPITPPPELVQQWMYELYHNDPIIPQLAAFAALAAQYGADRELEACCELVRDSDGYDAALTLRVTRRPEPPTLKEQALKALKVLPTPDGQVTLDIADLNTVRRALEALPNDC
jgi:hypothetical protein